MKLVIMDFTECGDRALAAAAHGAEEGALGRDALEGVAVVEAVAEAGEAGVVLSDFDADGGLAEKSGELAAAAGERLKELNRAAIDLATHGKMIEAVEEFARLADANRNIAVVLNAATSIVKYFEDAKERSFEVEPVKRKQLENRLEGYLNFVCERDPHSLWRSAR